MAVDDCPHWVLVCLIGLAAPLRTCKGSLDRELALGGIAAEYCRLAAAQFSGAELVVTPTPVQSAMVLECSMEGPFPLTPMSSSKTASANMYVKTGSSCLRLAVQMTAACPLMEATSCWVQCSRDAHWALDKCLTGCSVKVQSWPPCSLAGLRRHTQRKKGTARPAQAALKASPVCFLPASHTCRTRDHWPMVAKMRHACPRLRLGPAAHKAGLKVRATSLHGAGKVLSSPSMLSSH